MLFVCQVVLGVHGAHMLSSAFMPPSERSTVMEFFPEDIFTRDQEAVVSALGLSYLAWRGNQFSVFPLLTLNGIMPTHRFSTARKFSGSSLPSIAPPPPSTSATQEVPIDVQAIAQVVRETLAR